MMSGVDFSGLKLRYKASVEERVRWEPIWRDLAAYILPQYSRSLYRGVRGRKAPSRGDEKMMTSYPTLAARATAAGLQGGLTSPVRPWFRLGLLDPEKDRHRPFREWLDMATEMLFSVLGRSNFYNATASVWAQGSVFGTAVTVVESDFRDVVRAATLRIGEFAIATGPGGEVNALYRDMDMAVSNVVDVWGKENVPRLVRDMYERNQWSDPVRVVHVIEPSRGRHEMPWLEVYYVDWAGGDDGDVLSVAGYQEQPFAVFRWDVAALDDYGYGPGWIALPDVKELHAQVRDRGVGIEKSVDPPLQAHVSDEGRSINAAPGGLSYYSMLQGNAGRIGPLYEVSPDIQAITYSINELRQLIDQAFYKDLFLAIMARAGGSAEKTAREVVAIEQEKLLMLSPVLERANHEYLDVLIRRCLGIMVRGGLIPAPPAEIAEDVMSTEYISVLAQAQKMLEGAKLEQGLAFVGQMSTLYPEVRDVVDPDFVARRYLSSLQVPARMVRDEMEVRRIRESRAQAEQAAAQQQMMMEIAKLQGRSASEISRGLGGDAMGALLGGLGQAGGM